MMWSQTTSLCWCALFLWCGIVGIATFESTAAQLGTDGGNSPDDMRLLWLGMLIFLFGLFYSFIFSSFATKSTFTTVRIQTLKLKKKKINNSRRNRLQSLFVCRDHMLWLPMLQNAPSSQKVKISFFIFYFCFLSFAFHF